MDVSRFNPGMGLFEDNHLGVCRAHVDPDVYSLIPLKFILHDEMPGWKDTIIWNHTTRDMRADFLMGLLEISAGGCTMDPVNNGLENFFFVREGSIKLCFQGEEHTLAEEGYCYLPPQVGFELSEVSGKTAKVLWLRKEYQAIPSAPAPKALVGDAKAMTPVGDTHVYKQVLLPFEDDMSFDMCVNILTYHPGVSFPCVETHMCVHGCYVLDGRGGMWLNGEHNELHEDDYLYVAPCTSHYAVGYAPTGLRYLLYKDANRDYDLTYDKQ